MVSRSLPHQLCFYCDTYRIRTHDPCVMSPHAATRLFTYVGTAHAEPLHHGTTAPRHHSISIAASSLLKRQPCIPIPFHPISSSGSLFAFSLLCILHRFLWLDYPLFEVKRSFMSGNIEKLRVDVREAPFPFTVTIHESLLRGFFIPFLLQ